MCVASVLCICVVYVVYGSCICACNICSHIVSFEGYVYMVYVVCVICVRCVNVAYGHQVWCVWCVYVMCVW